MPIPLRPQAVGGGNLDSGHEATIESLLVELYSSKFSNGELDLEQFESPYFNESFNSIPSSLKSSNVSSRASSISSKTSKSSRSSKCSRSTLQSAGSTRSRMTNDSAYSGSTLVSRNSQ